MTDTTTPRCDGCGHDQHQPGTECSAGVYHGERTFHLCLCLARPDANRACPEQMHCQGGTLRYAELWYRQQGLTPIPEDEEPASAPKPTTALFQTPGVKAFAEAVDAERQRQLAKWGEQHHPDGTGYEGSEGHAGFWRAKCERAFAEGDGTWGHILLEEVFEAIAESDPDKLRTELVQIAAVCAAWVTDIDSRPAPASDGDQEPEATR